MELTAGERAVLLAASTFLAGEEGSPVLPLGELGRRTGLDRHDLHGAIDALKARGWLVCTGGLHPADRDGCILMGEGLQRAREFAARRGSRRSEGEPASPGIPETPG